MASKKASKTKAPSTSTTTKSTKASPKSGPAPYEKQVRLRRAWKESLAVVADRQRAYARSKTSTAVEHNETAAAEDLRKAKQASEAAYAAFEEARSG